MTVRASRWLSSHADDPIDRSVVSLGGVTVRISRWLSSNADEGITRAVDRLGRAVVAAGRSFQGIEPGTLQHNLIVVVWLIIALAFFHWTV